MEFWSTVKGTERRAKVTKAVQEFFYRNPECGLQGGQESAGESHHSHIQDSKWYRKFLWLGETRQGCPVLTDVLQMPSSSHSSD